MASSNTLGIGVQDLKYDISNLESKVLIPVSTQAGRQTVTDHAQTPTGLGRRGRRLSDEELQRRMLRAAVAMVHHAGLTVSLDHISFEDVIRDADVSRSAAYRRWPYKDLFFGGFPGELDTPGQRHELLTELFRRLALLDFQALGDSMEWRTYVALQAALNSITDSERRERVRAVLAASEQERQARVAAAWELLADLFGYRIRPETGVTFQTLITLVDAALRGLVIMAQPVPGIAALLEPDPAVEWDDERVARIRQVLGNPLPPYA